MTGGAAPRPAGTEADQEATDEQSRDQGGKGELLAKRAISKPELGAPAEQGGDRRASERSREEPEAPGLDRTLARAVDDLDIGATNAKMLVRGRVEPSDDRAHQRPRDKPWDRDCQRMRHSPSPPDHTRPVLESDAPEHSTCSLAVRLHLATVTAQPSSG